MTDFPERFDRSDLPADILDALEVIHAGLAQETEDVINMRPDPLAPVSEQLAWILRVGSLQGQADVMRSVAEFMWDSPESPEGPQ